MLRPESKARARALQLLYAWELRDRPPIVDLADRLVPLCRGQGKELPAAEALARAVADEVTRLDDEIEQAAAHWRLPRMGVVERNILRLGMHELISSDTPAPVIISEALRLAHWFAGGKAPAFINGVLDALARRHGRL